MKTITADILPLGALTPDDIADDATWVTSVPNNFDPNVTSYPRCVMTRALADGEPFACVALHPVLTFESLAPKPGTSVLQIARGLKAIGDVVDQVGKIGGFGEATFITTSEAEMELCVKRGWKVVMHDPDRRMWLLKRVLPRADYPTP